MIMKKKVTILWRNVPEYRRPFYLHLREYLLQRDIELHVIYGQSTDMALNCATELPIAWAKCVQHRRVAIGPLEICWQPYARYIRDADLIIVEQANRLLLNYLLIARRPFSGKKIAFWGHGRDLQNGPYTIRNRWKRMFVKHADWWFAYTADVAEEISKYGFPRERITNVQNTIDTDTLLRAKAEISAQHLETLKTELQLGGGPIGIYCGRMYKDKRIGFLLEACRRVREQISGFELLAVGSGEEQEKIISAARNCHWIHYVGPKYKEERVPYFLFSDLFLMPGLVGLVLVDCFALETPLVTTRFPFHSPEVAYVKNNVNGLITADNIHDYVAGICGLLSDPGRLATLKSGCRQSASIYTMQTMVENFSNGISACLDKERFGFAS
jgi:glycosyltransferase involved in cell wall biosynthesis